LKDIETKSPLSDSDIFRIASISKSFSATSIMQLREAGKLSLDDDFSDLVGFKIRNPKFPEKVITLRMIMSHTSSINDSQGYFTLDAINPSKNPDWAKCYSDYAPGEGYKYCNLNYNMVGTVIEKLSGERFDNYVKNHILNPLGLYGGYNIDSLDAGRFATLHEYIPETKTFKPSPAAYNPRREEIRNYTMGYTTPIFSPTGGMKISAIDLAKYMSMHMNMGKYNGKKIMSKKSAKIMQTKIADEEGYALALTNLDDLIPGKMMVGHTGSAYGLYSAMFFHPKEKFGIVVITNGCNPNYTNGINDVLRAGVNSLYENFIK
jgi:CubicO group peptidase (beta-lactamase class C family)